MSLTVPQCGQGIKCRAAPHSTQNFDPTGLTWSQYGHCRIALASGLARDVVIDISSVGPSFNYQNGSLLYCDSAADATRYVERAAVASVDGARLTDSASTDIFRIDEKGRLEFLYIGRVRVIGL